MNLHRPFATHHDCRVDNDVDDDPRRLHQLRRIQRVVHYGAANTRPAMEAAIERALQVKGPSDSTELSGESPESPE